MISNTQTYGFKNPKPIQFSEDNKNSYRSLWIQFTS